MGAWLSSVLTGLISKPEPQTITTKPATCANCGRDDLRVLVGHHGTVFCSPECRWHFDVDARA